MQTAIDLFEDQKEEQGRHRRKHSAVLVIIEREKSLKEQVQKLQNGSMRHSDHSEEESKGNLLNLNQSSSSEP